MEIISGVHKIDGVSGANCYLVTSDTEMILIDTGLPGNGKKIVEYVTGIGKNPSEIKYIFLTHSDMDHIGSAMELKRLTGAKVIIHAGDAPALAGNNSSRLRNKGRFVKILMAILSKLMHFPQLEPDIVLKENTDIASFKVLNTPGHSEGSISLYLPGKVIFVGDALKSDANGNPKPPSKALSADMVQAKASVQTIAGLEYDLLLVGHGAPVTSEASTKVKNLLANWK
jgi:glyoxylase-like metal-dependent hydrolase (beta-lactamase superfamily II)